MPPSSRYGSFGNLYWQIKEDWEVHYRDWTKPGFQALAVQRFGAVLKGRKQGVLSWILSKLYRRMFRYIRNYYGIELHDTTIIGRRLLIGHQSGIVIHENSVIGDDCVVLQNCTIGGTTRARSGEAPKLGNRVQIGCGVAIIGKVVIGDDVRIAPNVTVMTNIPEGTIVLPPPLRFIKPTAGTIKQFRPSL